MASSSTGDQLPQVAYIDSNRRLESGEAPKFLAIDPTHKEVAHHGFDIAPQLVKGEDDETGEHKTPLRDSLCGFKPKRFWIILCLVVILIIGGAVGGGVGGSIAASRKGDSDSDALDKSPSDPTTTSTSTAPDSTTSSSDSEDFTFRGFEGTRYEGRASDLLRGQGSFGLGFNASSYVWEPSGTPCCATLCRRSTWVGWWCQSRRQPDASATFDRVDISCSDDKSEDSSRARCITGFP